MKKLLLLPFLITLFSISACTDTAKAKFESYGDSQIVCMLNDQGETIRKFVSTGKVGSSKGGLHAFKDSESNLYVKITGTAIVSAHDYCPNFK